jgi:hypothetical protein
MILGFSGTAFPVLEESPAIIEYELFGYTTSLSSK